MDLSKLTRVSETEWRIEPHAGMRVPAVIYAGQDLVEEMDDKVFEQAANVARLPGILKASYAMPDAHWGYGFPIGGVAAFDPDEGVVSAGGVGFDISCGVRLLTTGLPRAEIEPHKTLLADALFAKVPAGVGSTGTIRLEGAEMDSMLAGGAHWALAHGYGQEGDVERIEERGRMAGANASAVSTKAKRRQRDEMARWAPATITSRSRRSPRSTTRRRPRPSGCAGARSWSRSTAARAASGTRSAASSCATWPRPTPNSASICRTASWLARRSDRRWAAVIWAPCAPRSTARSQTGRFSAI